MPELIIRQNRFKTLFWILVIMAIIIPICVFSFTNAQGGFGSDSFFTPPAWVYLLFSGCLALLFAPIILSLMHKLVNPIAPVVLSQEGLKIAGLKRQNMLIIDKQDGSTLVKWAEIKSIEQATFVGRQFIRIHLTEPEKYAQSGDWMDKYTRKINTSNHGTPLVINCALLKTQQNELVENLNNYWKTNSNQ